MTHREMFSNEQSIDKSAALLDRLFDHLSLEELEDSPSVSMACLIGLINAIARMNYPTVPQSMIDEMRSEILSGVVEVIDNIVKSQMELLAIGRKINNHGGGLN